MAELENFHLARNDFEQCTRNTFKNLLQEGQDFADVTLACGAETQLKAHKVILAACSPFFRKVLTGHPHPHPLLYLRGVSAPDLRAILAFMYQGETSVAEDHLDSFLSSAQDLQVEGLRLAGREATEGRREERVSLQEGAGSPLPNTPRGAPDTPVCAPAPGEVPVEQGEDGRFRCPKCDFTSTYRKSITRHLLSKNTHPEEAEAVAVPAELDPMDLDNTMEEETSAEALRPKEELVDKVQCDQCDFTTVHKKNLRRHVQRVHPTTTGNTSAVAVPAREVKVEQVAEEEQEMPAVVYACEKCDEKTQNKWDMSRHILRIHKEMKYLCDHCDFKTTQTNKLREHTAKNH